MVGVADFGHFIAAISLFTSLLLLVDLGFSLATTTRVAQLSELGLAAVATALLVASSLCLALGVVVSIASYVSVHAINAALFPGSNMTPFILAGVIYVPAAALASVLTGGLQGMKRYRDLAMIGLAGGLIHVFAVVGCGFWVGAELALWGAAAAMLIRAALASCIAVMRLGPKLGRIDLAQLMAEARQLARIALPASIAAIAWAPVNTFLLTTLFRHPNGASEVGAFGLCLQAFSLAMVLPGMLTQFALPKFASLQGDNAHRLRKRQTTQFAVLSLIAAGIYCVPVVIFAPSILSIFGTDYSRYNTVLQLMMLAAILSAPQGVLSNYLMATGKHWHRVWAKYTWGCVVILTAVTLADNSAKSAALAYIFGWLFLDAVTLALVVLHREPIRSK